MSAHPSPPLDVAAIDALLATARSLRTSNDVELIAWEALRDDPLRQFALLVEAMDWRRTVAPPAPRLPVQM